MKDQASLQDERYAPPRAQVEDIEPASDGTPLASLGQRFWAAMIDGGIAIGVTWLVSRTGWWNPWDVSQTVSLWQPQVLNVAIGIVLFIVLQGYLLARRGQTLGKAALGLRITRRDGSTPTLVRLIGLRYGLGFAANIVPAVGQVVTLIDCLMIFRASRRCLHDVVADTIVVKA